MKIEKIKITDYKVLKNFYIDFINSHGKISDTIVIAGINGTGKTTILELINTLDKIEFKTKDDFIKLNGTIQDIINVDNPIGLALSSELKSKIVYLKVDQDNRSIVIDQIKNFIDMIKDTNEDLTIKEANKKAVDEINGIFDGLELQTKFFGISKDIERNILFSNFTKENISLQDLSTGEQQLFIRALSLKMMQLKNSIILIDEPEISLHPNWQNKILKVYENIAKDGDNQLIIATHSPHIITSVANESLRVLFKEDDQIKVKKFDNSYGIEMEEVLSDIMDTKYLRTPDVAIMINQMWDAIHSNDMTNFNHYYNKLADILDINDKDLVLARLEKARIEAKR